jgi:hypothetical protein
VNSEQLSVNAEEFRLDNRVDGIGGIYYNLAMGF